MPAVSFVRARILCITLRDGSVGHAVLDGFGVAERSFFTRRLDHLRPRARYQAIVRLLCDSCRRYRPDSIVLGLSWCPRARLSDLAERLARRAARLCSSVAVRRLQDDARLLVERVRVGMVGEVIDNLAKHFAPDLSSYLARTRASPQYWRVAWYALAIALSVLVERHPIEAAALAQPGAFRLPAFSAALDRSLRKVFAPQV